ncbi:hypothetical protein MUCCIDRAFT_108240 [Mucor lusitanicus CBS 277.49]|uniref:Uncharacterized protein n=1 Tax=Mucor lusitanicus CBS 277.49 TaxID=747725 RepID=A0A168M5L2_MUCCL|nr:hypothetical protein MUCCIDRAFT_108240 [Mucor lusitanicus CBS 277.49]
MSSNDTKTRSGTNVRRAKGGEDVEGDKQQRWTREALQNEIIVREAQKDDDAINTDINEAEERVMALKEELKAALKEFDDGKFGQQIKEKKMTWIPGVKNDALYEEIEQLKEGTPEVEQKEEELPRDNRNRAAHAHIVIKVG